MDHGKLVVVQAFGSQVEADLAKSVLESAGIDAMIQADRAGGMRDHLAWSGFGFKMLVRKEDAEIARQMLTPPQEAEPPNLVVVQSCGTQVKAEIARGLLESAGIGVTIRADTAGGILGLGQLRGFRVLVREEDAATARDVLKPPRKPVT